MGVTSHRGARGTELVWMGSTANAPRGRSQSVGDSEHRCWVGRVFFFFFFPTLEKWRLLENHKNMPCDRFGTWL